MKLNYAVNQIVPISRAANIYSQHAHMACPNGLYRLHVMILGILVQNDFIGV